MPIITTRDSERLKRWKGMHLERYWAYMQNLGILSDGIIYIGPYERINNCWLNQPAFVIAASQALKGIDLNLLDGFNTITVNHIIEDYDKSKFHLFLDQRFLEKTTYDLRNYKGTIFQKNNTDILKDVHKTCRFKPRYEKQTVSTRIEDGLWNNCNSGIAALNLAIITGANPIYLLGHDSTNLNKSNGHHYKSDYTGEKIDLGQGMKNKEFFYDKFIPFNKNDRIINVCKKELSVMKKFKTLEFEDINLKSHNESKIEVEQKELQICHVGVMDNINEMGDISRQIYNNTIGKHNYIQYRDEKKENIPDADIYLLECFKNSHELYKNFKKPKKDCKIISLIHSSEPCEPSIESDLIITISDYYLNKYKQDYKNVIRIYAGIKDYLYKYPIDYNKRTIVRFSRNNDEKIHPESHKIIDKMIKKHGIDYNFFCDKKEGTKIYDSFNYRTDIKINMEEQKAYELAKCGIYAIANNNFIDTFSLSLLEAMASGLPILLLNNNQNAMVEVLGNAGIIANNMREWESYLEELINNIDLRIEYGELAKERSKLFTTKSMIDEYNKIFKMEF